MRTAITILTEAGRSSERHPIHPDSALRSATAAALNDASEMPRTDIRLAHEQEANGAGGAPIRGAWLVKSCGLRFLLAVKPWDHRYMGSGEADRPWVAAG